MELGFFVIFGFGILLVISLCIRLVNWLEARKDVSRQSANTFLLLLRFLGFIVLIIAFYYIVPLNLGQFLSISSITGIVIGFASSTIFIQVLAGIYILTTRPFHVNEIVQIGSNIGRVIEIGINYTVLQRLDGTRVKIPNNLVVDSRIQNYTKQLTKELVKKQFHVDEYQKKRTILLNGTDDVEDDSWFDNLSELFLDMEITRFTFDTELDFDTPPAKIFEILDKICDDYASVFDFRPKYMVFSTQFRLILRWRIYCTQSGVILNNFSPFLTEIANRIYGIREKVHETEQEKNYPSNLPNSRGNSTQ
jgi:hypothetical protein